MKTFKTMEPGDFVRVRTDHDWTPRRGKDGMVVEVFDHENCALIFGFDRHNQYQDVNCVGPENWRFSELDEATIS